MLKLHEIFTMRQNLTWQEDGDDFYAPFFIDDRKYGISAQLETSNGFKFVRVDFHFSQDGKIHHEATGFNQDSGKVLGIVVNGVKDKFGKCDSIWFAVKLTDSNKDTVSEYASRVKLYSRMAYRFSVEENLIKRIITIPGSTIFALFKNADIEKEFDNFI